MECGHRQYISYYKNMGIVALDLRIFVHILPKGFLGIPQKYLMKSFLVESNGGII